MAKMSVKEVDLLIRLQFKQDSLNECCFGSTSFIHWINSDEFLLIFDHYCLIYRLAPYYMAASLTDNFPVKISRIEIDKPSQSAPVILNYCLNLLMHPEVDANFARTSCDVSAWREINETIADPVFLQPVFVSGLGSSFASVDLDSSVAISRVAVEQVDTENHPELAGSQMILIMLTDGRAYAALKIGQEKYESVCLTSLLYDHICENTDLVRSIIPNLTNFPPTKESSTSFAGLKNIRQLGCFLSTSYWFPTNLRPPDNTHDAFGISLQRSGHLVMWRYTVESGWRNFRVVGITDSPLSTSVASATMFPVDETNWALLMGTTAGVILHCPISSSMDVVSLETDVRVLFHDDDDLRVGMMRVFDLDPGRYLLLFSRHCFITALVLTTSSAGSMEVTASVTQRTPSRFSVTDVVQFEDYFYMISSDKITKYKFRISTDIEIVITPEKVVSLDNSKIVGLTFTKNRVLKVQATMKRFVDRNPHAKPLSLDIRRLVEPAQLWTSLMTLTNLNDGSDYLILLRSFILDKEDSKIVETLLKDELQALDANEDAVLTARLKLFRFATAIFSGKRSKESELEFWNRAKEKVERLLMIRVARSVVDRATKMKDLCRTNGVAGQILASMVNFLQTQKRDVSEDFGQLELPHCPLCNAKCFQSLSVAEHTCANCHRLPACALTFLPLPSFSYRKCGRCSLPFLQREKITDLMTLFGGIDCCTFCDGLIVSP